MELKGRRALVTGAGVRLGRALASALMRKGVHVAIHYHGSEAGAKDAAAEGSRLGVKTALVAADLSDAAAAQELAARAREALGGLDILINSAAIMEKQAVSEVTPADWERTMNLNLRGSFFAAQGAAAAMGGAGGAIVNIADLAAFERWSGYAVHVISKAAVVVMTELMAKSFAPLVRVNAIAPGAVLLPEEWDKTTRRGFAESTPLGRLGSVDDVAGAMFYLLENEYVTGETIVVDGGRRIR